mmetsp:Transcript_16940/g.53398  ORF Transcript_16940/g.53398 Transcript_16940/m.53398 type:complete len:208 (-) Transcript_16940:15-638(-)
MASAMWRSTWVIASMGSNRATVRMLKQSCTVAPAKARRYSSLLPKCARLTMVFVTDVPMLAPMIMGIALSTFIRPAAVMVMMIDVLVDEDWTRTVARMPITRPAKGLLKISLFRNVCPAVLPPSTLKAFPIRPRDIMKRYSSANTQTIFRKTTKSVHAFSLPVFSDQGFSVDCSVLVPHFESVCSAIAGALSAIAEAMSAFAKGLTP